MDANHHVDNTLKDENVRHLVCHGKVVWTQCYNRNLVLRVASLNHVFQILWPFVSSYFLMFNFNNFDHFFDGLFHSQKWGYNSSSHALSNNSIGKQVIIHTYVYIWSQSYQTFFLRKRRIFPFFADKLDHFSWIHIFPFLTNTQT